VNAAHANETTSPGSAIQGPPDPVAAICRWGAQHRGLKPPDVGLVVATKGWFGWSQPGTWSGPDDDTTE
jgi:hypothetical protein